MRGKTVRIWMIGSVLLLFVLLLAGSFIMTDYEQEVMNGLVIEGMAGGESVELSLWKDETDGRCYLFVPSWFSGQKGEYTLQYPQLMGKILIDGTVYNSGDVWMDDGTETVHELVVQDAFGKGGITTSVQVLASKNLPSIFVAVEEKDGIISTVEFANKQYLESGYLEMRDADGSLLCQEELSRFKVRGNLTAMYDKKPFSFEFKEPVSVLGMEEAVKWNLLSNSTDGAYIRNKIIRDMAFECIDAYEPEGEFAELYLNGEYQGLYLVTEAVEIAENRIEIDADDSWFVEMELDFRAREDYTQIITQQGQIFIVHSEEGVSKTELATIESRLNDIESALFAEDGISTISGKPLEELIDLESFAEAWLVEELTGDHDIGITSQTLYASKDEDSLWYSGPVWDFDGIMTNVNTPMYAIPESLTGTIAMTRPEDNKNQNRWLAAMWNYAPFREIVEEKYRTVFRDSYEEILKEEIDEHVKVIHRSAVLDAFRWHEKRLTWWFTYPAGLSVPAEGDYDRFDTLDISIDVIKDFMSRKLEFLDKLWIEKREFCVVEIRNPAKFLNPGYLQTLYYWVEKGTPIENMPHYEEKGYEFEGYYDIETGESVTNGTIIESDRIIEGRWTGGEAE